MFEREKVEKGNKKTRIVACKKEGGKECLTIVGFETLLLVRRHSKTIFKMPTK